MPHQDFDALRQELDRANPDGDPLTFTLFEHLYTCLPAPYLGDSFDLMDAPEPMNDEPEAVRAITRFIRRLLASDEDRAKWDAAMYKLKPHHGPLLIALGVHVTEQYVNRPTTPPSESSDGRPGTGASASELPAEMAGAGASTP